MNRDLKQVAAARRLKALAQSGNAEVRTRLYLLETRPGMWVVREENDRRGGVFVTQAAALKFIRSEFGARALIVAAEAMNKKAA